MWHVFRSLIHEEVQRLWRRLLRRPEPPSRYARVRVGRGDDDPPVTRSERRDR